MLSTILYKTLKNIFFLKETFSSHISRKYMLRQLQNSYTLILFS